MDDPTQIIAVPYDSKPASGKTKMIVMSVLVSIAAITVLSVGYMMNSAGLSLSTRATLDPVNVNILPQQTTLNAGENIAFNVYVGPNGNNIKQLSSIVNYDPQYLDLVLFESSNDYASISELNDGQIQISVNAACNECVGVSGDQNLFTFIFQSTGTPGETTIVLSEDSDTLLIDESGQPLSSNISGARLIIN